MTLTHSISRLFVCGLALLPIAFAQTLPLSQDAYVVPQSPINYGTATTLNVGGPSVSQALVQFDLSTLPTSLNPANISKATLTLFAGKVGAAGTINVSRANGNWNESTVNGANSPVASSADASGFPISSAGCLLQRRCNSFRDKLV